METLGFFVKRKPLAINILPMYLRFCIQKKRKKGIFTIKIEYNNIKHLNPIFSTTDKLSIPNLHIQNHDLHYWKSISINNHPHKINSFRLISYIYLSRD
jgi:hypothetical protein